eukprot:TRINITY_DN5190_c0_g1_i1.p1 TRINITY_DN5190_c0_g1~~TRINITY_DN5190_c0_g1_i1.p1  ORF type:complete len:189 (-),score=48.07 TRINITY_DN5190_c0_g1_i1:45-569(-)
MASKELPPEILAKLSPQEKAFYDKFKRLPNKGNPLLKGRGGPKQRFDSGEYFSKGKGSSTQNAVPVLNKDGLTKHSSLEMASKELPPEILAKLSPQEKAFYDKFKRLPNKGNPLLKGRGGPKQRFDSGEYFSKGKGSSTQNAVPVLNKDGLTKHQDADHHVVVAKPGEQLSPRD